jgi:hypothetical protein
MPGLVFRSPWLLGLLVIAVIGPGLPSGLTGLDRLRNVAIALAIVAPTCIIWARRMRRCGIGVGPDGIIVKGYLGSGDVVDWPEVVKFDSEYAPSVFHYRLSGHYLTVICNGQAEPLRTPGCFYISGSRLFGSAPDQPPLALLADLDRLNTARRDAETGARRR